MARDRNIWRFWNLAVALVIFFWIVFLTGIGFVLWMLYNVLLKQGFI